MEIRIEQVEPMRVAFVRHVGPYGEVGIAWEKLCAWAGPKGLLGPNTKMMGLCHDDPEITPEDKIRYDACLVVGDSVRAEGEIGVQETPGGEYAVAVHEGPYDNLSETYAYVCGTWLPAQGREPGAGPSLECYRNSPHDTAPADLVTDVYVPLGPK